MIEHMFEKESVVRRREVDNSRLQRARLVLQQTEDSQGVCSYRRRTLTRKEFVPGVYEVGTRVLHMTTALGITLQTESSWAALVGVKNIGWEALADTGTDLRRVVAIECSPELVAPVLSTLLEGFDVVAVGRVSLSLPQQRTLAARARLLERTILTAGAWPLCSAVFPFSPAPPFSRMEAV